MVGEHGNEETFTLLWLLPPRDSDGEEWNSLAVAADDGAAVAGWDKQDPGSFPVLVERIGVIAVNAPIGSLLSDMIVKWVGGGIKVERSGCCCCCCSGCCGRRWRGCGWCGRKGSECFGSCDTISIQPPQQRHTVAHSVGAGRANGETRVRYRTVRSTFLSCGRRRKRIRSKHVSSVATVTCVPMNGCSGGAGVPTVQTWWACCLL